LNDGMQAPLDRDARDAVAAASKFAAEAIAPNANAWEKAGRIPAAAYLRAAELGLCRLIVPREQGGLGLSVRGMAAVMGALAAECMATAFSLVVHNNLAGNIARNGNARQRGRYLPDMTAGRRIGAFLLTEPGGGSDAAAIRTRATRDGEGWRIDGDKAWVSNGAFADVLSVYAQTDPGAGWRGIASFLVDADAAGVERDPAYGLLGGHALGTCGIRFDGCRVSDEALLSRPGEAFKAAMAGIDLARVNVAAMCCAMLARGLDVALECAAAREAFGQRVLEFQGIQWMLADAATDLEAARLLTGHAAALLDGAAQGVAFSEGADSGIASAHAKKFATRVALARLGECMQAMGAAGFRTDVPLARHFAAAKMAQYLDGTTEIQNVVIARGLIKGRSGR
jgi:alkylation response protein AidB-like acyl-CoA dehydrogenase